VKNSRIKNFSNYIVACNVHYLNFKLNKNSIQNKNNRNLDFIHDESETAFSSPDIKFIGPIQLQPFQEIVKQYIALLVSSTNGKIRVYHEFILECQLFYRNLLFIHFTTDENMAFVVFSSGVAYICVRRRTNIYCVEFVPFAV